MKRKGLTAAVLALMLALGMLAGCANSAASDSDQASSGQQGASTAHATERTITDMAGREVTIPTEVKGVYCAVPTGEATVATLAPDKLIGWVNEPSEEALRYLPENFAKMPVVGGWMGQNVTANIEDIIALDPDVIIYMGSGKSIGSDTSIPDDIQTQTGIPVVVVSSDLADTATVYRQLGDWLDEADRGEQLAFYYEKHFADITSKLDAVPASEHPTVYYAENTDGLATDPEGSSHTEVLSYVHVINVADVEMKKGQGRTEVSIEQVIEWNPQIILCHSGFVLADDIVSNPQWADIQAVQNGRVYNTPAQPFNWFDRPPNAMRLLGIEWFAKVCYPDIDVDVDQEISDFFKLFYNVDLTDEQLAELTQQETISFTGAKASASR